MTKDKKSDVIQRITSNIANNVRRLRKKLGYTQDQLAERSGIPRATMAGVEKQNSNPTLAVITSIAEALEVSIDELMREGDPRATLVRSDASKMMISEDRKYQSVNMAPVNAKHIIIQRTTMQPGAVYRGKVHARGTQEFHLAVKGSCVITVVDSEFHLQEGDLLYFNGDQPHTYENRGSIPFESVCVITYANVIDG